MSIATTSGESPKPASSTTSSKQDDAITRAREAGRLAGERLARTPLTPRQRATVATVMGGVRR